MQSFIESKRLDLNLRQLEAVVTTEGPLLVLAGAGSGKTRVLTYRMAHLVFDHRVPVDSILAMTFSNKAAREMHDRVVKLLHMPPEFRLPWISTFHSVCARLLRKHAARIGYTSDYVIYDTSEQEGMIKSVIARLGFQDAEVTPDSALAKISNWKNQGITADRSEDFASTGFDERCSRIYRAYAVEMLNAKAMDFDDLLLNACTLFANHEDLRDTYRALWRYVLVDEFQDTNEIQSKLLKLLLNPEKNLCVVGDDDQSIYGWRGAKVENILSFDKDFDACRVIRLEQNYRSTGNVLAAATAVISKNEIRHAKTLWTEAGPGEKIRYAVLQDDRSEAQFVVSEIRRHLERGMHAEEIAVFYRVNSLSRGFEEECLRQRIPYRIVGGFRFYERKEIKDVLSYFRLLLNPSDIQAFRRTVNMPPRGIGKVSVEKLEESAAASQRPIAEWLVETKPVLSGKARLGLQGYLDFLSWGFEALKTDESFVDLVLDGIRRIGYFEMLAFQDSSDSAERKENLEELLSAVQEFEETWQPQPDLVDSSSPRKQKLRDFLERVSLMSDLDQIDSQPLVTFMSLHAAKGLEFDLCFLTALEEGLFPSARSFDSFSQSEEERRLCYVGITRAKQKLYLTRAARRRVFGSINFNLPSRFIKDIPVEVFETVKDESEWLDSHSFMSRVSSHRAGRSQTSEDESQEVDFDFDQRGLEESFAFHKGDRVQHPSFGDGVVQKAEWMGEEECLAIAFRSRGLKKVLAKFVKRAS